MKVKEIFFTFNDHVINFFLNLCYFMHNRLVGSTIGILYVAPRANYIRYLGGFALDLRRNWNKHINNVSTKGTPLLVLFK